MRRLDGRLGVAMLVAAIAVATVAVYATRLADMSASASDTRVPWWAVALVFFLVEARVVHLHFRSEAHSLSLSELGLVLGLFFLTPGALLLAQLCGAGVALLACRRQRPLKAAFNLAQFAFSSALAVLIFHALTSSSATTGPVSWASALLGVAAASIVGVGLVSLAISIAERRSTRAQLPKMTLIALIGSVATASLAVAAVELLRANAWGVLLLLAPGAGCALAFRAYAAQRRQHQHLEFLYQSIRAMQGAQELRSAVRELLQAARTLLSADFAEIIFLPPTSVEPALRSASRGDDERLLEPTELRDVEELAAIALPEQRTILLARGRAPHRLDAYLADRRLKDGMLSVLRADDRIFGLLLVGDRAGDVATFTSDDSKLLETFASHAAVLIEKDRVKEQLRYQAFHDGLTELPNRVLLTNQVAEALAEAQPHAMPGVLFVDLDDFKTVNDSLGHGAGDQLLVAVAERLRACIRPGDAAARLGGDEFAILLASGSAGEAEETAKRIVDALRAPFVLHGREVPIHASVGIACAASNATTAEQLLQNADVAMYAAKANGKRGYAIYEPEMHTRIRRRHELSAALERAVERDEIVVHYQPIVSLANGRTVALEALARWRNPDRGILLPGNFLPLAEEMGWMVPIGRAVLQQACRQLRSWQETFPQLAVSVNLSAPEIQNPCLADEVDAVLSKNGIEPDRLIVEITETGAMCDPKGTIGTLHELRRIGVRLALDDFGTGYSSLSHLRQFPLDIIKIAKPFVDQLDNDHSDTAFLDAILRLASALDLTVVAEGIERAQQADVLRAFNCGLGQGYHFARPLDHTRAGHHLRATGLRGREPEAHVRVA
ncbi:MAG TPA: EAL domain-containing protein [Gaiellaceae bacterium]|nr:EAL domain-containing protein [Gaiellaceae bacterium]